MWHDLATIDTRLDSRAVTFENPTGARGAGGRAANGRKGAPYKELAAGDIAVLMQSLSHASLFQEALSRRGIPSVVNTKLATARIRTGDSSPSPLSVTSCDATIRPPSSTSKPPRASAT